MPDLKGAVREKAYSLSDELIRLSHMIHANPEVGFEEHQAARWVGESLASSGFAIEVGVANLPTAFVATIGKGELTIGICAEYDALPAIGHACGHNVIAASAVCAARALAPWVDELGITLKVFGTPAEESGGGKIIMLEHGHFGGVHAAMMVHPSPRESRQMQTAALGQMVVQYTGRPSHAATAPERGINAADAQTIAQVAIGLLRQQLPSSCKVHGIVTDGGDAPNVIPGHTTSHFYFRSPTLAELSEVRPRIERCFEAGALATGAELQISDPSPAYSEFKPDQRIGHLYQRNAEALGRVFPDEATDRALAAGSTDMANLSLAMPTIHPLIEIDCGDSVNHQPEFAAHCARPSADKAVLDAGLAMAWTTIDLARNADERARLLA